MCLNLVTHHCRILPAAGGWAGANALPVTQTITLKTVSLCRLLAGLKQKFWSASFTQKVLAVHQLFISCIILVSLARLAG